MAITTNSYTGDGSTTVYSISFPYVKTADVKATLDGSATTAFTVSGTNLTFTSAPASGVAIKLFRETNNETILASFQSGSALRAVDMNTNFTQSLYVSQETTTTAGDAVTTADSAVTTANSAVTTANAATSTANSAVTTANSAVTTANAATATANTASSDASSAVTTANTASTNASAAVTTANSAETKADNAVSTANTASTNASNAVSTANTANTTANSAVTTANTASTNASNAVTTANNAQTAVNNAAIFVIVNNVAAIPGSPSDQDRIEITDSSGVQQSSVVTGLPTGFVGDSGLYVRLKYQTSNSKWNYVQYGANDIDDRYVRYYSGNVGVGTTTFPANGTNLKISDSTISRLVLEKTGTGARVFEVGVGNSFLNVYDATADEERIRIDNNGNVGIGTTSPSRPLDVVSNSSAETLTIRGASANNISTIRFASNDAATNYGYIQSRPTYLELGTQTAIPLQFATDGISRLTITSTGNAEFGGFVRSNEGYTVYPPSDSNYSFATRNAANNTWSAYITADGSATFADGDFTIGSNGWLQTTQEITSDRTGGNVFRGKLSGTTTSSIAADGSATFAGNIQTTKPRSSTAGSNTGGLCINPSDSTHYFNFRVDDVDNKLRIDTLSGADKILFGADGSATFASGNFDLASYGALSIKRTDGNNYPLFRWGTDTNYSGGGIYPDGSVTFAASNFDIGSDGQLTIKKSTPYSDPSFRILDRNNSNANGVLIYGTGCTVLGDGATTGGMLNVRAASGKYMMDLRSSADGSGYVAFRRANNDITGYLGNANGLIVSGNEADFAIRAETHLVFGSNGHNERMRIHSSGNIGIGETDPYYKLHMVFSNATTSFSGGGSGQWGGDGIRLENSNTTVGSMSLIHFRNYSADWHVGSKYVNSDDSDFCFFAESNEKLRIKNNGNVGIGTTNPLADLVVSNGGASGIELEAEWQTNTNRITNFNRSASAYNKFRIDALEHHFAISGSEKVSIDSSGNVGIGTTSPDALLDVENSSGAAEIQIKSLNSSDCTLAFGDSADTDVGRIRYAHSADAMLFFTAANERMRIDSSGRLLINNTSVTQSHPLQVTAVSDANAIAINGRSSDDIGELTFFENDRSTRLGEIQYRQDHVNFRHRVGDIRFATAGSTERMRIDSSGYVKINTTSGTSKLNIYPASGASGRGEWDHCGLAIGNSTVVGEYSQIGLGYFNQGSYAASYIGYVSTSNAGYAKGDLVFGTRDVTTDSQPTERMRIESDGDVVIKAAKKGIIQDGEFTLSNGSSTTIEADIAGMIQIAVKSHASHPSGNDDNKGALFYTCKAAAYLTKVADPGGHFDENQTTLNTGKINVSTTAGSSDVTIYNKTGYDVTLVAGKCTLK